jgi:NADH-quinone oxidoreductase subunit C
MNIQNPVPTLYGDWKEKFSLQWNAIISDLKAKFPDALESILLPETHPVDIPTLFLKKENALEVLRHLKDAQGLGFLTDYTASDEGEEKRFHLIVHLMSAQTKVRLRLKVRLGENETMPTLIPIWEGANWAEREIFDMFGIRFDGHPDLRRILMDVRWEGHPLRKDYPLRGYQVFLTPEPIDPELFK